MNRHIMNNCDIAGGRNIGANAGINAINVLNAETKLNNYFKNNPTSTCTGDIAAPNIYKKRS